MRLQRMPRFLRLFQASPGARVRDAVQAPQRCEGARRRLVEAQELLGTSSRQVRRLFQSKDRGAGGSLGPKSSLPLHLLQGVDAGALQQWIQAGLLSPAGLSKANLANNLFHQQVAPRLQEEGYKTHGIKSRLHEYLDVLRDLSAVAGTPQLEAALVPRIEAWLQSSGLVVTRPQDAQLIAAKTRSALQQLAAQGDVNEKIDAAFEVEGFMDVLKALHKVDKRGHSHPILKNFSAAGMSRPGWPKSYKELLQVLEGDNIRHVVRNATLKRALGQMDEALIERGFTPSQRNAKWKDIAQALELPTRPTDTLDLTLREVYKALYLHRDNLFAGDGATNQLIGFLADPLIQLGEKIEAAGSARVSISETFREILGQISSAARKIKAPAQAVQEAKNEIAFDAWMLEQELLHHHGDLLPGSVLGWEVANLGQNFGFDLINGRTPQDQQGIARRQARLLQAEEALQNYRSHDDPYGRELVDILRQFLALS